MAMVGIGTGVFGGNGIAVSVKSVLFL